MRRVSLRFGRSQVAIRTKALLSETLNPYTPGVYRTVPPHETVLRSQEMARKVGITRVADVTGLDHIGIPVVMVVRPRSRSLSVAQGKGLTLAAARASGLMESIEAFHAENITAPLKWGNFLDLSNEIPITDVDLLPRLATSPYSPEMPILWIEGTNLIGDEPAWLPLEVVTLDFTYPNPPGFGCFTLTSNGLASGNNCLEAVLHGLCEVIERDADVGWSLRSREWQIATRIDLDTIDDSDCCAILAKLESAGLAVVVWETTSDIRIPTYHCSIVGRSLDIGFSLPCDGMGCHPERGAALQRALLEAVQSRATFIAGSRDDIETEGYRVRARSMDMTTYLRPGGTRSFRNAPDRRAETLNDYFQMIVQELSNVGLTQLLVVDLRKENIGASVVRVVVPGLLGLREGYPPNTEFMPMPRAVRASLA